MNSVNHVVSSFLRALVVRMKELGVSQTALAKRMKVSRPYVVKILHGDVNISFGTAMKFARALGMDFVPGLAPSGKIKSPPPPKSSSRIATAQTESRQS